MPPESKRVWTTKRKVIGNLLPLLIASPLLYQTIKVFGANGASITTVLWATTFPIGAWIAVALFGLVGNKAMKKEVSRRMHIDRPFDKTEKYFIGIASPTFRSALDPHEDVGFLVLHSDTLEFYGSERHFLLNRRDIVNVRFTPNTHTLLGLGRWLAVEAVVRDLPARLLIEPREKKTLIGNLLFSKTLKQKVDDWYENDPRTDVRGSLEATVES